VVVPERLNRQKKGFVRPTVVARARAVFDQFPWPDPEKIGHPYFAR
jgi:hypothetical protein